MKKRRIYRIILISSFLPCIILLLISVYYAVFGYDVYTWILPTYVKTIFGMEAFVETLCLNSLGLCFIPILPLCLLYQVVYLILYIVKKIKYKEDKLKS